MNPPDETLSKRLRDAAVSRTDHASQRVDDFVLDEDGVIDLRRLDDRDDGRSIASPPAALRYTRGRLGDAGDMTHLYDDAEPDRPWWRRAKRAPQEARETDEAPTEIADEPETTGPEPDVALAAPTTVDPEPIAPTTAAPEPNPPTPEPDVALAAPTTVDPEPIAPTTVAPEPDPWTPEPPTDAAPPFARLAALPSTNDLDDPLEPASDREPKLEEMEAELAEADAERPTATCPKCAGTGHRDLFDRFSQIEFYSCDLCLTMWQQEVGG